jgi:hypothetical protein
MAILLMSFQGDQYADRYFAIPWAGHTANIRILQF